MSKTKPILFSTPMVQAKLNGTKTQTRRIVKQNKLIDEPKFGFTSFTPDRHISIRGKHQNGEYGESFLKMKICKGDILWVRETFQKINSYATNKKEWIYKADGDYNDPSGYIEDWQGWKPSIFMPKEACRLFLEVTDVHVERLQDISEEDARAEGARGSISIEKLCKHVENCKNTSMHETLQSMGGYQLGFLDIWADIHGLDSWFANPWVWVYRFKQCEMPKDFLK